MVHTPQEIDSLMGENKFSRITRPGVLLRSAKFDEIPQLFNVLKGDMSLVGPRPEMEYYVQLYPEEYKILLSVRPGITSPASIRYIREQDILSHIDDPESYYIKTILPEKLRLDARCVEDRSLRFYFKILWTTLCRLGGRPDPNLLR